MKREHEIEVIGGHIASAVCYSPEVAERILPSRGAPTSKPEPRIVITAEEMSNLDDERGPSEKDLRAILAWQREVGLE